MKRMFVFGFGYTARVIGKSLVEDGWQVTGTTRAEAGRAAIAGTGATALVFDGQTVPHDLIAELAQASHVLISIAPDEQGDPVLRALPDVLAAASKCQWIGYLSTVGVYGDHDGAWVDEATPPVPVSARSRRRIAAEQAWQVAASTARMALQVFRLAGIYGPGRSAIDKVRAGTARRLVKPGQVFNRIHVDDIASAVLAGLAHRDVGGIFNVTDDHPCPPQDVVAYAAKLLGKAPPPEQDFATAALSPMARSFYGENKRVSNTRLKTRLGYTLRYPTYREGLRAVLTPNRCDTSASG